MIQLFLGLKSGFVRRYPLKTKKHVAESLQDYIHDTGALIGLMCDNAKPEMYGQTRDILCMYEINDQQSKPHYQHQNPAECKIQDVKRMMNSVMDCTGTPSKWWLLAALYVLGLVCLPRAQWSMAMGLDVWRQRLLQGNRGGQGPGQN